MRYFALTYVLVFLGLVALLLAALILRYRRRAAERKALLERHLRASSFGSRPVPTRFGDRNQDHSASLIGLASSGHVHTDEHASLASAFSSGQGGDFAGAGASGRWDSGCSSGDSGSGGGSSSSDSGSCSSSSND